MNRFFEVGDLIYGFCYGFFGRDDYYDKICVFVTEKYAVFEYVENNPYYKEGEGTILNFYTKEESKKKWGNEEAFYEFCEKMKIPENEDFRKWKT